MAFHKDMRPVDHITYARSLHLAVSLFCDSIVSH